MAQVLRGQWLKKTVEALLIDRGGTGGAARSVDFAVPLPSRDDSIGKPRFIALPVVIVRVIGHPRRTAELDLFQHTCLRLIDAEVDHQFQICELIGLEPELVDSVLESLKSKGLIKIIPGRIGIGSLSITANGRDSVSKNQNEISDEISHVHVFFDPVNQHFWPTFSIPMPPLCKRSPESLEKPSTSRLEYMVGSEGSSETRQVHIDNVPRPSDEVDLNDLDRWHTELSAIIFDTNHSAMANITRVEEAQPAWVSVPVYVPRLSMTRRPVTADPFNDGKPGGWIQRHVETLRRDPGFAELQKTILLIEEDATHIGKGELRQSLESRYNNALQRAEPLEYLPPLLGDELVAFHYALNDAGQSEGADRTGLMGKAAKHAWAIMEHSMNECLQRHPVDRHGIIDSISGEWMDSAPVIEALTTLGFVLDEASHDFLTRALAVPALRLKKTLEEGHNNFLCQLFLTAHAALHRADHPLRQLARDCPHTLGIIQRLSDLRTRGSHAVELERGFSTEDKLVELVHNWASWLSCEIPPPAPGSPVVPADRVHGKLRFHVRKQVSDLLGEDYSDLLSGLLVDVLVQRQELKELSPTGTDHPAAKGQRVDMIDTFYRAFEGLARNWLDRWILPEKQQGHVPGHIQEAFGILSLPTSECEPLLRPRPQQLQRAADRSGATLAASVARLLLEAAASPVHPFRNVIEAHPGCLQYISRTCDVRKHLGVGRIPPEQDEIETIADCVESFFRFDAAQHSAHLGFS